MSVHSYPTDADPDLDELLRPPTPELVARIASLVRAGTHPELAAHLCGIDRIVLHSWLARARHHARRQRADLDDEARIYLRLDAATRPSARQGMLADGLPGIFKPVLSRDEAAVVRAIAQHGVDGAATAFGRDTSQIIRTYEDAAAKLGVPPDAEPGADQHAVAARAREDDFITRLCDAFEEVLAPVVHTLDTLDALVTPAVCPGEFLPWLARLVALKDYGDWPAPALRKLIANAVYLYRRRGTRRALSFVLEIYAEPPSGGVAVAVEDPGGSWVTPGSGDRPSGGSTVVVHLHGARRPSDDAQFCAGIDSIVALFLPTNVAAKVEVHA